MVIFLEEESEEQQKQFAKMAKQEQELRKAAWEGAKD
jgi:hypothetical protein